MNEFINIKTLRKMDIKQKEKLKEIIKSMIKTMREIAGDNAHIIYGHTDSIYYGIKPKIDLEKCRDQQERELMELKYIHYTNGAICERFKTILWSFQSNDQMHDAFMEHIRHCTHCSKFTMTFRSDDD